MKKAPLIFDGAMGTVIYDRGVFINTCYDELCLTNPKLILQIHRDYVEAGAEVIETNTFGANPIRLKPYGLAEKTEAINRAGVRLAREAAGDEVFVAGSVGPCTESRQRMPDAYAPEVEAAFRTQMGALAAEGVDLFLLETFSNLNELLLAAGVAKAFGHPVLASFVIDAIVSARIPIAVSPRSLMTKEARTGLPNSFATRAASWSSPWTSSRA